MDGADGLFERDKGLEAWTGVPALSSYTPALSEYFDAHFERDEGFFEDHPPPAGERPPAWLVSVSRPSNTGGPSSQTPEGS